MGPYFGIFRVVQDPNSITENLVICAELHISYRHMMCSNVVFDRLNKQKKIQANLNFSWSTVPSTMLNQRVKIVFSALSTLFALAVLSVLCAIVQCNCAIVQLHCLILEICLTL